MLSQYSWERTVRYFNWTFAFRYSLHGTYPAFGIFRKAEQLHNFLLVHTPCAHHFVFAMIRNPVLLVHTTIQMLLFGGCARVEPFKHLIAFLSHASVFQGKTTWPEFGPKNRCMALRLFVTLSSISQFREEWLLTIRNSA